MPFLDVRICAEPSKDITDKANADGTTLIQNTKLRRKAEKINLVFFI